VLVSSPAAAQRCTEGAGLDSGTVAAAQSAMPSIAACRRTDCKQHFHWRRPIRRFSATVPNLHQLDGRDLLSRIEESTRTGAYLAGDVYSLADAAVIPYIARLQLLGLDKMWADRLGVCSW